VDRPNLELGVAFEVRPGRPARLFSCPASGDGLTGATTGVTTGIAGFTGVRGCACAALQSAVRAGIPRHATRR
jgi:hypothetical protein